MYKLFMCTYSSRAIIRNKKITYLNLEIKVF